jgi:thioredoxin-related protein
MKKKFLIFLFLLIIINFLSCSNKVINIEEENNSDNKLTQEKITKTNEPMIIEAIPKGGIYNEPFRLELVNNKGFEIFYTTDMNNYDTNNFQKYNIPITIDRDTNIRFYAKNGNNIGNIKMEKYKIIREEQSELTGNEISNENDNMKDFISQFEISLPQ